MTDSGLDSGTVKSLAPVRGGFRLEEQTSRGWLWVLAIAGVVLIALALLLDLAWGVENILPTACLSIGVGTVLFALLFVIERRIIRRTSLVWVSAVEELDALLDGDAARFTAHYRGPVAAVYAFLDAILTEGNYGKAWRVADPNWRLCRAQAWLWANRDHPLVASFDRDDAARSLAADDSTHELWGHFAATELEQFTEAWADPDVTKYGAASASRPVADGEIVFLTDVSGSPSGLLVTAPTLLKGVPFLVRQIDDVWVIANVAGDSLPEPGWPPDWKEGWTYWADLLQDK